MVRFKMPLEGQTAVPDLLRGDVMFDNSQFTDYVLLKSNGLPTYHLATWSMTIYGDHPHYPWRRVAQHRPIQPDLFKAFGWEMPVFVHLPVILNPSGKANSASTRRSPKMAPKFWCR
ncbi:MAG: hypothetical protein IPJ90_07475 [Anaerolineaceae bacterium]|nr:hypothetical protein [Anaerolineaceae bacterium]